MTAGRSASIYLDTLVVPNRTIFFVLVDAWIKEICEHMGRGGRVWHNAIHIWF